MSTPQTSKELQPHQQRVVAEEADLGEKMAKLDGFIGSPMCEKLEAEEQTLLGKQLAAMAEYRQILQMRIARWNT